MKLHIRPRGSAKVRLKFIPGIQGPQGIQGIQGPQGNPGDITPEFLALAAETSDARDAAVSAAGAANALWNTLIAAMGANIPAPIQYIRTAGYAAPGDGGGALLKVVATEPAHAGKWPAQGGKWLELVETEPTPLHFGAPVGGASDCYPAFWAWLNYKVAKGVVGLIPRNTYRLNSTLLVVNSDVAIKAEPGTLILNGQANAPAIQIGNGGSRIYSNKVDGLMFAGAPGITGVEGQCGLKVLNCGQFTGDELKTTAYEPLYSKLYDGLIFDDVAQFSGTEWEVQDCLRNGITMARCVDPLVDHARSDGNGGAGWHISSTEGFRIQGSAYGNGLAWHFATHASGNPNKNGFLRDCVGDTSDTHNWLIEDLSFTELHNCWGGTQKSAAANTWASGFALNGGRVKSLKFVGGSAINNNAHGVHIIPVATSGSATFGAPTRIVFSEFSFGDTTLGPTGNGRSGSGYGLNIDGGTQVVDVVRVKGGQFAGNASGAFWNGSSGTSIFVTGNPIGYRTSNSAFGVVDTGATTAVISHSLGGAPAREDITITPQSNLAGPGLSQYWISDANATTFTVTVNTAAAAQWFFSWTARLKGA